MSQPTSIEAIKHVVGFAELVGIEPGLLGMRQVGGDEFKVPLDVLMAEEAIGGRRCAVVSNMVGLIVTAAGEWQTPIIEEGRTVGYQAVSVEDAAKFAKPYLKSRLRIPEEIV